MTTITITIPNPITNRVIDSFCLRYKYSAVLENGSTNPETKAQFAKRKIIDYIKTAVREAEIEQAQNAAATIAGNSVDADIILS